MWTRRGEYPWKRIFLCFLGRLRCQKDTRETRNNTKRTNGTEHKQHQSYPNYLRLRRTQPFGPVSDQRAGPTQLLQGGPLAGEASRKCRHQDATKLGISLSLAFHTSHTSLGLLDTSETDHGVAPSPSPGGHSAYPSVCVTGSRRWSTPERLRRTRKGRVVSGRFRTQDGRTPGDARPT